MAKNETKNETNNASSDSGSKYVLELKQKLAKATEEREKKAVRESVSAEKNSKTEEKEAAVVKPVSTIERQGNIAADNRSYKKVKKEKTEGQSTYKGVLKKLGIVAISIVLVIALIVGGYVGYLQISYSRIEDMRYLEVNANPSSQITVGTEYSITTFNIGFGAYSQGYSFFMDEGVMADGTPVKGEHSRALSEEEVKNNTNGAISLVYNSEVSDFYFFQEVDTDSSRSYYIDQAKMITDKMTGYGSVFASNFHTGQLFYPLNEPIGKVNSGLLSLSRYNMDYSVRRSLPVDNGFINKFFDLDRCFIVTKVPVYNGGGEAKYLVLINVHLSAYDDGNIREQQLKMLYEYMKVEYENGNYVIAGGDFNHSLAGDSGVFKNKMQVPNWCKNLPDAYNEAEFGKIGYNINYDLSTTIGTCRDASRFYSEGENLEVILDGFITSKNIVVTKTETIDGDFKNSDHNPVRMSFKLV